MPWLLAMPALMMAMLAGAGCQSASAPSASQADHAPARAEAPAEEATNEEATNEEARAPVAAPSAPDPSPEPAPGAVDDQVDGIQVDDDPRVDGQKRSRRPSARDSSKSRSAGGRDPGETSSAPLVPVRGATPAPDDVLTGLEPGAEEETAGEERAGEDAARGETPATEEPAADDPYAEVEAFFASLPEEAIVFHVPRSAPLREAFVVRLVVQPGADAAALKEVLVEAQPEARPGDIHTREAKLAPEMQATLTSATLSIKARGAETQLVRRDAPTEWSWDVTAPAGGSHRLTLALYAVPRGRASGIKVKTFDETLVVKVPFLVEAKDVLAENWEWMWTLVVGPLLAVGWRRWRRTHPIQR